MHLPPPHILTSSQDVGICVLGVKVWAKDIDPGYWEAVLLWNKELKKGNRISELTTFPLQSVALFILRQFGLVPEHVESRPLYNPKTPYKEVGQLEIFVDLFPLHLGRIPPPIDISPRKPRNFQLRLVIWKTTNVILSKRSFGTAAGDIYVRAYFNGATKKDRTDIHYRCLNGTASFNWRFVLDFDVWLCLKIELLANYSLFCI